MKKKVILLLLCAVWAHGKLGVAQDTHDKIIPKPEKKPSRTYYSTEVDRKYPPCMDTIPILMFKQIYDISPALPSWVPVDTAFPTISLEGLVYVREDLHKDCHVSSDDLPFVHYGHDFTFNLRPDSAHQKYLAQRIYYLDGGRKDTVRQVYYHCEWESGIAAGNKGNPCYEKNIRGESCGFFSAGHKRRDVFWNFPAPHDWVHVEGKWIWDRGHPPAYMEIHPARALVVRRNLPEKIRTPEGKSVFAARIDCYFSGDGGALVNNLPNVPAFVERARMSAKDYTVKVRTHLPRPSPTARLRYTTVKRPGDTFAPPPNLYFDDAEGSLTLTVPYTRATDVAIFARTYYLYWDEGDGCAPDYDIFGYKVTIDKVKLLRPQEFISRSEFRLFLEVGGEWIFLNEFVSDAEDILNEGIGKTYRRTWDVNRSYYVFVPRGKYFRVHAGGWEADGLETVMGKLYDPNSPCTPETKAALNDLLFDFSPVGAHGCYDDKIDEVHDFHTPELLGAGGNFVGRGFGEPFQDPCPFASNNKKPMYRLYYRIEPITGR